jgi:hypothetical protein
MNHSEFFDFLKKWRELGKYPPISSWPKTISLGSVDFWNNVKRLYDRTLADNFEYESSFFFVEGNILSSEPFKGEQYSVSANHSLRVEYEKAYGDYYNRKTIIDGKVAKTEPIKLAQIQKELKLGYFFNLHTHPVYYLNAGISDGSGLQDQIKTYGFFSDTDINSLLMSNNLLTCLITDELWIAAKTDKVIQTIGTVGIEMLQNISHKAYSGDKYLEDTIKSEMKNWGLVFYRAKFGQSLQRVI